MSHEIEIRRELRPGDLGAIVGLQARWYAREHGLDASFESGVAAAVGDHAARGWPGDREGVWIVERDGELAGCLALTAEGEVGWLRWFMLDPAVRGRGLGRRLVDELVAEARGAGFARLRLETFHELRTAAHLYRSHGFEVVEARAYPRWGRDDLTFQFYECELAGARRTDAVADPVAGSA